MSPYVVKMYKELHSRGCSKHESRHGELLGVGLFKPVRSTSTNIIVEQCKGGREQAAEGTKSTSGLASDEHIAKRFWDLSSSVKTGKASSGSGLHCQYDLSV